MPSYELALIVKALSRPELGIVLKRTCENIMQKGGIVRNLENLGHRTLPFKMSKHGQRHITGNYFIVNFDSSPSLPAELSDFLHRDVDIVRPTVVLKDDGFIPPCKLTEQECNFGEQENPDHEKRLWRGRIVRKLKLRHYDKKKENRM